MFAPAAMDQNLAKREMIGWGIVKGGGVSPHLLEVSQLDPLSFSVALHGGVASTVWRAACRATLHHRGAAVFLI